jgi:HK97 family phage portal protein
LNPAQQHVVTPDMAMRIADVYACVRCLSDAAASLPLHLYRHDGESRRRVTSGRTAGLLDRPAPSVTQANLIGQLVAHLNLHGDAFLGKFRSPDGTVDQLAALPPSMVEVRLVGGEPEYTLTSEGGKSTHGPRDILHIRALATDGLCGLSPIAQCAAAMRMARGAADFMDAYLRNGARLAGIYAVEPRVTEAQTKDLQDVFEGRHQGVPNMHKVMITNTPGQWQPMSSTLGDMEFVEQRRLSTAEIARIFRVPLRMIGAPTGDSQTYANVESTQIEFVTHSLRPWLVLIEQAISQDPDLCPGGLFVEFLLDALLRADSQTRATVYTAALNPDTGWMTRAEVRALENLPPDDNAPAPPASTQGAV